MLKNVDAFNYEEGGWGTLYEQLFDEPDAEDQYKMINGKEARDAGDSLRERLLQDRAATSVVTALLLTISFAMLCLDPNSINHTIIFNPDGHTGIPYVTLGHTMDLEKDVSHRSAHHGGSQVSMWSIGLVRLTYVLLNVVSTMLSFISIYGGTWEYLLINKCPAHNMIFLVQYLHDAKRSGVSKMLEPWKATVGAAVALVLAMVVLVYALYGSGIFTAAVLVISLMSAATFFAFKHLKPELVFKEVHRMHNEDSMRGRR